jgi:putative Mg2+ transporter-C (MgtC) family protein
MVEPLIPHDLMEVGVRLLAATLIGSGIGLDREVRRKPAGMRTHALVSLGAALLVVVVVRVTPGGYEHVDAVSRVIQGIIAGVGFLGGGAILKSEHEMVHGLTTAASIWLVASLGIACGAGQWVAAVIACVIALLILTVGSRVEGLVHRIFDRNHTGAGFTPPPAPPGTTQ